jgi:hypothetical protein
MKRMSIAAATAVLAAVTLAGPAPAHPGHGLEPGHGLTHLTEILIAVAVLHLCVLVARRLAAWRRRAGQAPARAAG